MNYKATKLEDLKDKHEELTRMIDELENEKLEIYDEMQDYEMNQL